MFTPAVNRMDNREEMLDFIRHHGFGILFSSVDGTLEATHLPVELEQGEDGQPVLRTHMSAANGQGKRLDNGAVALLVFQGPHAYISSSWYDHANVSTWNYTAVHVTGRIRMMRQDELHGLVSRLTSRYEATSDRPVLTDQLDDEFMRKHLAGITGLEISMDKMEGKRKLSQNRDEKNYENILHQLQKRDAPGDQELKNDMQREKVRLFGNQKK